jgi:hypothetical protein
VEIPSTPPLSGASSTVRDATATVARRDRRGSSNERALDAHCAEPQVAWPTSKVQAAAPCLPRKQFCG